MPSQVLASVLSLVLWHVSAKWKKVNGALLTSLAGGLAAVLISTPLNVIFWGGTTGNVWGDAVFAATQAANLPVVLGSFLDEVVVDVPDKIITVLIVFAILKGLPKKTYRTL